VFESVPAILSDQTKNMLMTGIRNNSGNGAGIYSLAEYAPGTEVTIIADDRFSPVCRRVVLNNDVAVTVSPGRRIVVVWPTGTLPPPALRGSIYVVGGVGCPIPLSAFQAEGAVVEAGHVRMTIKNFVDYSEVEWITASGRRTLNVREGTLTLGSP
jgi:hypothetical protein